MLDLSAMEIPRVSRPYIPGCFLDPAKNATIGVRPRRVFSLRAGDFTGSPTRWTIED
jgi:hypothetical protein